MRKFIGVTTVLIFFLTALYAENTEYTNNSFARLSYISGNSYIQKATDLNFEEGEVNMPVTEGDRLGTTDGRVEIYLGKGNYIRLDSNTKVDFLQLPKAGSDLTRIRIWSGNVYLCMDSLEREKSMEIHTSDVSFYLLDSGNYRIDVRENAETEIFVFQGMIEAAGESNSVLVKDAQRLEVIEGHFTSRPTRFHAASEDSFDRWSENREAEIRKHISEPYLPEELEDFEYELSSYGEWDYVPSYGNVWIPRGVHTDWRPYYYGRWTWMGNVGWTWISYHPWGWVTSHYGRWHWNVGLGWYWIPTRIWGPAWVSWYGGYNHYGWAPMSYYGYPGYIINNVYYGRGSSYFPYDSRSVTVVHKSQLQARNISKVSLNSEETKKVRNLNLSQRAPSVKPAKTRISVQKLDGNKVFLGSRDGNVRYKPGTQFRNKDSGLNKTENARSYKSSGERRYYNKKLGYPSSPDITSRKYSSSSRSSRSNSSRSRFYNRISSRDKTNRSSSRRYSNNRNSRNSSSKRIGSSSSRTKSRSSSTSRKRSSSSSQSRSKSKSGKTKKKK